MTRRPPRVSLRFLLCLCRSASAASVRSESSPGTLPHPPPSRAPLLTRERRGSRRSPRGYPEAVPEAVRRERREDRPTNPPTRPETRTLSRAPPAKNRGVARVDRAAASFDRATMVSHAAVASRFASRTRAIVAFVADASFPRVKSPTSSLRRFRFGRLPFWTKPSTSSSSGRVPRRFGFEHGFERAARRCARRRNPSATFARHRRSFDSTFAIAEESATVSSTRRR